MSIEREYFHPGVYVADAIEDLEMTQNEFAIRADLLPKTVSMLVNGEINITFDIATKLANFFGTGINMWLNLQNSYNIYLYEKTLSAQLEKEWEVAKLFDKKYLKDLVDVDIVRKNKQEIVELMKSFFMVNSLENLKACDMFAFCRTSVKKDIDEKQIILRNAWISYAMFLSRDIECKEYSEEKLRENLPKIRALMKEEPAVYQPLLKQYLNEAGIKFIITPYLKGSNLSGVTRWLPSQSAIMIAINDYGKDAGKIWFNIFHEIGHAIKNKKRHLTISFEKNKIMDDDEIFANDFANNQLISKKGYKKFITKNDFSIESIKTFSDEENIPVFITIGRLLNDGYISWNMYNEYRVQHQLTFDKHKLFYKE